MRQDLRPLSHAYIAKLHTVQVVDPFGRLPKNGRYVLRPKSTSLRKSRSNSRHSRLVTPLSWDHNPKSNKMVSTLKECITGKPTAANGLPRQLPIIDMIEL